MRIFQFLPMCAIAWASAPAYAGPSFTRDLSSNERVGIGVSKQGKSRAVSAAVGMWSDDGALELGGFRDGPANGIDPAMAQAAELVSGKPMHSQGVRLSGTLYQQGSTARGWSLSVDARRQRVSDVGAALGGDWRTSGDSRLSLGGRLRF
jgi:hypothetical protein